jgi:type IV secretion system protein VirB6
MACAPIHTGQSFLQGALAHIDCQAQSIGSFGWAGLADPGSPVSLAMASLLTIFVAIFGVRVMLGYPIAMRDGIAAFLKVGIVLTLAASWPAWRVLGYDLFIDGPGQLARAIGTAAGLPGSAGDIVSRLQTVDTGISALNVVGTGRLGVAQGDWFELGFSRIVYLVGTLGPLALLRIAAGFLIAIAPLMAGLLLFSGTVGLFEGWLRALVGTFLGAILTSLALSIELSLLEPWLQEVLDQRSAQQATLDAPVELLAMSLAFTLICIGGLFLVARLCFHTSVPKTIVERPETPLSQGHRRADTALREVTTSGEGSARAATVAHSISENIRREARLGEVLRSGEGVAVRNDAPAATGMRDTASGPAGNALGSSWRRPTSRISRAAQRRDGSR